jgi:hypothetical protein
LNVEQIQYWIPASAGMTAPFSLRHSLSKEKGISLFSNSINLQISEVPLSPEEGDAFVVGGAPQGRTKEVKTISSQEGRKDR